MSQVRVGFDMGENSVGEAAVEVDDDEMPVRVLHLISVLHDSGKDGLASGQTAQVSRKASGGAARRVRKLVKSRKRRALKLEAELIRRGYPLDPRDEPTTYGPWEARIRLLDGFISDGEERRELLAGAIRHMSNHRGWANAWVSIDAYIWKEEPSPEFEIAVNRLLEQDRFDSVDPESLIYQADIARLALSPDSLLRPRKDSGGSNLLGTQRRVDVVREWRAICRAQRVPDEEFLELGRIAFGQERPKVPVENVGNDWLPGFRDKKRAAVASLEHQEFKIRQLVANLATRPSARSRERSPLAVETQQVIVDHLMGVTSKSDQPTWKDLAEQFVGVPGNLLVHFQPEEQLAGFAPVNASVLNLHESLPKKHPVIQWWLSATPESRSEFMLHFGDPAEVAIRESTEAELDQLVHELDEAGQDRFAKLKLPSGRSSHSLEALRLINAEIERTGDRYPVVRNRLFNGGADLQPVDLQDLETVADHPTLQRILPIIRRFLRAVERESGAPKRIVIEHVRGAFQGFQAKQEESLRIIRNRRDRERARNDIVSAGLGVSADAATNGMIHKFQAFTRQNSACLYCGATPGWTGIELDHIVPRASGGNSTRANLAAVCHACNAAKGKQPFAVFAASGLRPGVSLEATLARVDAMLKGELDNRQFWRLKSEIKHRLRQTELDDPIDERALASTAYAAVDMRQRIRTHYDERVPVDVYSGRIVQEARKASGIDKRLQLREGIDVKSRFDRRHHAIDAAVALMINQSVASTLAERSDLRRFEGETGEQTGWREFEGSSEASIQKFRRWKAAMARLAELILEQVDRDEVVVTYPVRYSARHAALHLDGRVRHKTKPLGEAWTSAERARIVDDRVYVELSAGALPSADLEADDGRTLRLPSGIKVGATGSVYLFPDASARQPLPNASSAMLGATMHHIRLYRWFDAKGKRQAGVVRVWASDLYDLRPSGIRGDLLADPLPESSRAVRRAKNTVRDAIFTGGAEHVGTFVIGDEILIDPVEWAGANEPGRFLAEFPERHWRLLGGMSDSQFTLGPLVLSREGLVPEGETGIDNRVSVSPLVRKVLSDRLLITASTLWRTPSTLVIRRTSTGAVRPPNTPGMPSTWGPHQAVYGD